MKAQHFGDALTLLERAIDQDPLSWSTWYMAGQCCRFMNDIDGAIERLARAKALKADEPSILLALGIAFQLSERWDEAKEALGRAIEFDPDYELAYNSLALTQKKCGELDNALNNYEAGAHALARRLVKAMQNERSSPIVKHRDTKGQLWSELALYAATYLASMEEHVERVAWPTGEQAMGEERTERHEGLFWVDSYDGKKTVRLFLPNYFNTFREALRLDGGYAQLIGNRGTVLELLGRNDEAQLHFQGAGLFCKLELPLGLSRDEGPAVINDLNELELSTPDAPPSFGAWCLSPAGRPAYVTFLPNLLHRFKIEHNLAVWMVFRSAKARAWLER